MGMFWARSQLKNKNVKKIFLHVKNRSIFSRFLYCKKKFQKNVVRKDFRRKIFLSGDHTTIQTVLPIMRPVRLKSTLYNILEYCLWRSKWIDFSARIERISGTQTGVATSRYSFSRNYFWSSIFVVCYLSPQKVWGVELSQFWRNNIVCVWGFSCLRKQVAPPKIAKHLKLIPIYLGNQVLIF